MRELTTDKLPAGSRPLYRILTEKSPLNFGKYADFKLGDVLKINEEYVVWMYATMPQISLHDSILERLGLPKIKKPGIDEQVLKDWHKREREKYTEEERLHGAYALARKIKRNKVARLMEAKDATRFTKGQLQAINHGHGANKGY